MPFYHLFIIYLIGTLIVFLPSYGFAQLFKKAGIASWKAYVPFYNTWEMQKLTQRPKHWVFWQIIPVVGWFISLGIFIEFVKLFGRFSFLDHTGASLFAPFYFTWLGNHKDTRFVGIEVVKRHKKAGWREWVDAAVFAIVAATLIRLFVFEAYTIPTGSMEKTLLVNDFLFVSKLSYGPRVPNTPLSIPFVHNYIPGTHAKSYSELIKLPYIRWFESPVKRYDAVVFNFPEGDTVINKDGYQSAIPYYNLIRNNDGTLSNEARQRLLSDPSYPIAVHPVDKTDNYIKRCVGIPGDTLQIINGDLFVNNEKAYESPTQSTFYSVRTVTGTLGEDYLRDAGVRLTYDEENPDFTYSQADKSYHINMTRSEMELVKSLPGIVPGSVTKDIAGAEGGTFPYDTTYYKWTVDNFGKIWVPKKGTTITLTPANKPLYKRCIEVYEGNKWEERDGKIFLNGVEATTYTFKMDYYWMMGDNRHKSQDSRYWGFVPEDHVVGKAWMIWFSFERGHGPRWNRFFKIVK